MDLGDFTIKGVEETITAVDELVFAGIKAVEPFNQGVYFIKDDEIGLLIDEVADTNRPFFDLGGDTARAHRAGRRDPYLGMVKVAIDLHGRA